MFTVLTTVEFDQWLDALRDSLACEAIAARLLRIEAGLLGDHKGLGGGLSEMRVHVGPGYRLYCTFAERTCVIVLCGGDKSAQRRDIRRARDMLDDLPDLKP